MLPIVLVLFVAQSAFAAPSVVGVQFKNFNEVAPVRDNGKLVSSYLTDGTIAYIDGGDTPLYAQMMIQAINDMADTSDTSSWANAVIQTIATVGELANGVPGDACEAAALINAYAYSVSTGNSAGLRAALPNFVQRIAGYVDTIVQLVVNPNGVRYSSGPRGKCLGGGRSYQFEEAWDGILDKANAYQIGLLNEEYCAAKRLYNAFNIRSNNVAAAVTAVTTGPVNQLVQLALPQLAQFLRVVANGANPVQAGANAKNALLQSLPKIQY
ncbi:fibroin light chain-like [Vanessa atalanta]|uniref:fibroin light chain-like n=1 Tax=Vanessa atalanta TaxID=42275 RepID=UPI001FCD6897|nr:fibroin light chain-like [Vanessa atalanta]